VYLGTGETTDKELRLRDSVDCPGLPFLDGGANGGLIWAGSWTQNAWYGDETQTRRIVITGSNRVECVMSGAFNDTLYSGVKYPIYVIKRGTGVWRMADNANRGCGGGYAIEEGTLRYDSIAEKGVVCSLGTATNLTENYTGRDIENHRVPYAILLGSDREGTMEFTGSKGAECSTRPVAVNKKGVFKVSGEGDFRFSGISALAGEALLKLDTDRTGGVEISGLTDGGGILSVEKTGAGTIELDGELSFSGALKVSEGKLVVKGLRSVPYSYFRWTLKEKAFNSQRYKDAGFTYLNPGEDPLKMAMQEFALFDAEGRRVNANVVENKECMADVAALGYGEATICGNSWPTVTGKLSELFDSVQWRKGQDWNGLYISAKAWPGYVLSNPNSWMQIVERLPENASAVASYDLAYSFGTDSTKGGFGITAFSLEGSIDGRNWNLLAEQSDCEIPSAQFRWLSSPDSNANRHNDMSDSNYVVYFDDHKGFSIDGSIMQGTSGALAEASSISVAPGATLEAVGNVAVSGLTLDPDGNGTISGIEFAADGTLKITDALQSATAISIDLKSCKGLDNLRNWPIEINGRIRSGWSMSVSGNGEIKVSPPGLVIMVK
jgi:autotransporter-associated beta strand protein